jgi:hypothetical protein
MKKIAQFCALIILTLSLAHFAYADDGHMDCPGATVPPTPPPPTATAPGDILQPIAEAIAVALLSLS